MLKRITKIPPFQENYKQFKTYFRVKGIRYLFVVKNNGTVVVFDWEDNLCTVAHAPTLSYGFEGSTGRFRSQTGCCPIHSDNFHIVIRHVYSSIGNHAYLVQ